MADNQMIGDNFYCSLKINGYDINYNNIISLVIREWVYDTLPRLELKLMDEGTLLEVLPLSDDDIVTVEIAKDITDDVNRLNMSFDIVDHQYDNMGDNKGLVVYITGILSTTNIFENKTRAFSNKKSIEIFQTIANENNLKLVNPHNISPNDSMIWYQSNQQTYEFIKYVRKRMNITDDVGLVYCNSKNEFVVTSLNSEINKHSDLNAKYDTDQFGKARPTDSDDKTIYFSSYALKNIFGRTGYELGYGVSYSWYDGKDVVNKNYTTQPDKTTDNYFANHKYSNQIVENITYGIHNNVYQEYFDVISRYEYMLKNFFSMSLLMNCDSIVPINLCDKINVSLPSRFGSHKTQNNDAYSGEYIVGGIIHQISKRGVYVKQLSLHRNGYNNPFGQPIQ